MALEKFVMTLTKNSLDEAWPLDALEAISACPYCGGTDGTLAYEGVQDWSFGCAPGTWRYWDCGQCHALYLNPRPTPRSIASAYARYYTHATAQRGNLWGFIKQRLRHEYWSHSLRTNITPRLGLPRWAGWLPRLLKPWIAEPFGLRQLVELPKGFLIDVGCGNGGNLKLAQQLGWQTSGIELDASAVKAALAQGLNVIQGGYEALARYEGQADCVICSHVLEHVHDPLPLLRLLLATLKLNGVLLLSAPNASSYLRDHYGESWRGLEAPRHLAIPDAAWLMDWIRSQGLLCTQFPSCDVVAMIESERIKRRGLSTMPADIKAGKRAVRMAVAPSLGKQDIVQIVCTKVKG